MFFSLIIRVCVYDDDFVWTSPRLFTTMIKNVEKENNRTKNIADKSVASLDLDLLKNDCHFLFLVCAIHKCNSVYTLYSRVQFDYSNLYRELN